MARCEEHATLRAMALAPNLAATQHRGGRIAARVAASVSDGESQLSIESWGPKAWGLLHIGSFMYPEEPTAHERRSMFNFLHSLSDVIPCSVCRTHFTRSLAEHAPSPDSAALSGRDALSRYLVDLHNQVNARTGKRVWRYEEAAALYASTSGMCPRTRDIVSPAPAVLGDDGTARTRDPFEVALIVSFVLIVVVGIVNWALQPAQPAVCGRPAGAATRGGTRA